MLVAAAVSFASIVSFYHTPEKIANLAESSIRAIAVDSNYAYVGGVGDLAIWNIGSSMNKVRNYGRTQMNVRNIAWVKTEE